MEPWYAFALLVLSISGVPQGQGRAPKQATQALSPQDVFRQASPSIFIVEGLSGEGAVLAFGSGVAVRMPVGPAQPAGDAASELLLVTNKHVIYGAVTYRVRKGEKAWPASLVRLDQAHDLCALKPEAGWTANPTPVRASSDVEVGERVYAIGAPEGLELTLSEGLVSALRHVDNRPIIQTSAPVSHGSSGGGLFDSQGRLIGVTAFSVKGGQNLNFALPTEWVLGLGGESAARFPPSASGSQLEEAKKWSDKGFRAYLDEKYQEAIDYYKEAVRLNPDDHRSWQYLGKAELQLRRYADALEALRQATRLEGEDAQDWVALSWAYIALGRYEDAVDAANSAWLLDNENAGSWALLTGVYLRAGKCDEALENSEVTLVLFPGDKWAEAVAEKVQARCGSR